MLLFCISEFLRNCSGETNGQARTSVLLHLWVTGVLPVRMCTSLSERVRPNCWAPISTAHPVFFFPFDGNNLFFTVTCRGRRDADYR